MSSDVADRAVRAETKAFVDLYDAAAVICGTSTAVVDNVHAVLSPRDDDAGYSPVLNLADAADRVGVLHKIEQLTRERGATQFGVNGNPDIDRWMETDEAGQLGYRTVEYEYFWDRQLLSDIDEAQVPKGVDIELLDPAAKQVFGETLNIGFGLAPDHVRGHAFASTIGRRGWHHYLARIDGQPACASVLFVAGDVAQLFVTTTVPEFRSRGLQTYMIRRRLFDGAGFGCDLAICQTVVDNSSPRNMARQGFELLYKRGIIEKQL